jgi:hypothetical protein
VGLEDEWKQRHEQTAPRRRCYPDGEIKRLSTLMLTLSDGQTRRCKKQVHCRFNVLRKLKKKVCEKRERTVSTAAQRPSPHSMRALVYDVRPWRRSPGVSCIGISPRQCKTLNEGIRLVPAVISSCVHLRLGVLLVQREKEGKRAHQFDGLRTTTARRDEMVARRRR